MLKLKIKLLFDPRFDLKSKDIFGTCEYCAVVCFMILTMLRTMYRVGSGSTDENSRRVDYVGHTLILGIVIRITAFINGFELNIHLEVMNKMKAVH